MCRTSAETQVCSKSERSLCGESSLSIMKNAFCEPYIEETEWRVR